MEARIFTKDTLLMHCYQPICNDIFETELLGGELRPDEKKLFSIMDDYDLKNEYSKIEIEKRSKFIYSCENIGSGDHAIFGAAVILIERLSNGRPIFAHVKRFVVSDYVKNHPTIGIDHIKRIILQKVKDDFKEFNPDFEIAY